MIISVAMNSAMTIDSTDTFGAERDRPHERAADEQIRDAEQHRGGKRRQRQAIGMKPATVREIDEAEAVEEFREGVAAERDEAPEHERVHETGERPLLDGPPLQQDVDHEAAGSESGIVEGEGLRSRGNQLDAARHLRRERARRMPGRGSRTPGWPC